MRLLSLFATILLSICAQVGHASEGMLTFSASEGGYVFGTSGWTFQPLTSVSVTSLGVFDYIMNPTGYGQSPMSVGLWADDGTLLASNSVTATSPLVNLSRYEPITPVTLAAGLTYHLGAYFPSNGVTVLLAETPGEGGSATMAPEIQLGTAIFDPSGFAFPNSGQGGPGAAFLVPNFQFTVVPEPAAAILLLLGGLTATFRKLKR